MRGPGVEPGCGSVSRIQTGYCPLTRIPFANHAPALQSRPCYGVGEIRTHAPELPSENSVDTGTRPVDLAVPRRGQKTPALPLSYNPVCGHPTRSPSFRRHGFSRPRSPTHRQLHPKAFCVAADSSGMVAKQISGPSNTTHPVFPGVISVARPLTKPLPCLHTPLSKLLRMQSWRVERPSVLRARRSP